MAAFFVTFNSLFSDGPTSVFDGERLVTYGLSLLVHAGLAAAGVRWGRGRWTTWMVLAATPSVAFALLYSLSEPGIATFAAVYGVLAVAGAILGARLGRAKASRQDI